MSALTYMHMSPVYILAFQEVISNVSVFVTDKIFIENEKNLLQFTMRKNYFDSRKFKS